MARIRAGEPVSVTLDALPGVDLSGTVSQIAPVGVTQQGVVNYPVVIALANTPPFVRAGMTANANIIIAESDNVLMVPIRAVKFAAGTRTGPGGAGFSGAGGGNGGAAGAGSGQGNQAGAGAAGGQFGQGRRGQFGQGQPGQGAPDRGANGAGGFGNGAGAGNFQRRARQATVTVLQNGQEVSVPVQVGLSNDTMTEVVSGLNEGDEVVVNLAGSTAQAGAPGGPGGFGFLGRFGR